MNKNCKQEKERNQEQERQKRKNREIGKKNDEKNRKIGNKYGKLWIFNIGLGYRLLDCSSSLWNTKMLHCLRTDGSRRERLLHLGKWEGILYALIYDSATIEYIKQLRHREPQCSMRKLFMKVKKMLFSYLRWCPYAYYSKYSGICVQVFNRNSYCKLFY